jgi:SRSO17 transposase
VVLSIIVPLPFVSHRRFAIPFMFRLYRKKRKARPPGRPKGERKSTGDAMPREYRTRPELAVEMLRIAAEWLGRRRFRVVADSEYSGKSVSRELPETAHLVGRMVMPARPNGRRSGPFGNATLYEEAPARKSGRSGRPRKKGVRLPNPAELAKSRKVRWTKTRVDIYGKSVRVWLKSVDALWYNSAGTQLLRVVVVRDPSRRRRDDCFFTTDLSMTPTEIIETIAKRWALEVTFRDVKQSLGFEEPQSRTRKAVERTAPMAMLLYGMTVLWYAEHGEALREKWPKVRLLRTCAPP